MIEGILSVYDILPQSSSEIFSNYGQNWNDFHNNMKKIEKKIQKNENNNNNNINNSNNNNENGNFSNENSNFSNENSNFDHDTSKNAVVTKKISVTYMLTALNMAVKVPAQERVESLFNMAMYLSTKYDNENDDNNSPLDSPVVSPVNGTEIEPVEEEAYVQYVQIKAVEEVVRHLNHTWQVPSEKRVTETGVKYPIRTYREKTAQDMINTYQDIQKPPLIGDTMTKEEFSDMLLGSQVCVWAECYRGR
mmetsp:Transcript_4103/g.4233  ORF Transcript_4103/g.4233 Transcript_4103/m.4233 type:complete len:249 (+) Transcript_4103:2-748(+)